MFTQDNITDSGDYSDSPGGPTITSVLKRLARCNGKLLDEKQYITHEMVCCTILLQSLNEALDLTSCVSRQIGRYFSGR